MKKRFDVGIIAHRGFSKQYPENTLLAFQKALDAKADYIELDVQLTGDGVLVVNHDDSVKRVTGEDYLVENTDFATLRTLDFGRGEKIPTMREVFELCKGKMGVQIELKSAGTAEPTVKLVTEFAMENEVIFSSFNHSEIAKVKELNPALLCAVLEPIKSNLTKAIFKRRVFIEDAEKYGVEGIHPLFKFVNKTFCKSAHDKGFFVNPWTVDSPKTWAKLIKAGVDAIITNDPEALYKFLSEKKDS